MAQQHPGKLVREIQIVAGITVRKLQTRPIQVRQPSVKSFFARVVALSVVNRGTYPETVL